MNLQMTNLNSETIPVSKIKLRVISGILFVLSCAYGLFYIREKNTFRMNMMSRVPIYDNYGFTNRSIWVLLSTAVVFLITALALFVISFKKQEK